jgi:hypothetical protein
MGGCVNLTLQELASVVLGRASDELQARVIADLADPNSRTHELIAQVERWARTELNSLKPGAPVQTAAQPAKPSILVSRRAAVAVFDQVVPREATLGDFAAWCNGTASPDAAERVRLALSDPRSELRQHIGKLEEWAKRELP